MGCVGAIAGMTSALVLAASDPVVIGTSVPHPPYGNLDAQGNIVGFDRDVGDEVCRRAALRCNWVSVRFDLLLPGVASGEFDIAMAGIAVTPARVQIVSFTVPYDIGGDVADFIGRPDAPLPDQARIGVQAGTIHEGHLRATGRTFRSFGTPQEVLGALRTGDVDLAFGIFGADQMAALYAAAGIGVQSSERVEHSGTAMAVCRGNDALLHQLDAALRGMLSDGTIDKIAGHWAM
jgi:polar amino acid transport system substrate-binding protein